jgi:hypothetical protein
VLRLSCSSQPLLRQLESRTYFAAAPAAATSRTLQQNNAGLPCTDMDVLVTQTVFNFAIHLCTAVVQQLRQALDQLSFNKRACKELADRIVCLREPLQQRALQLSNVLVQRVTDTLQGIEQSVDRYIAKSYFTKVLQAGKYRQKFEHFHCSIGRLIEDVRNLHAISGASAPTATAVAWSAPTATVVQVCVLTFSALQTCAPLLF